MTRTLAVLFSIGLAACSFGGNGEYSEDKVLKASGVRLDVEQGDGNALIKGDEFQLNLDTLEMSLKGNASVSIGEPVYFRADAAKISLKKSFEVIELKGNVQAILGERKQSAIDVGSPHP